MPPLSTLKNIRFWILVLTAALLFAVNASQFYFYVKDSRQLPRTMGFALDVQGGSLVVARLDEKGKDGKPTLGAAAGVKKGDRVVGYVGSDGVLRQIRGRFDLADARRAVVGYDRSWSLVVERPIKDANPERLTVQFRAPPAPGEIPLFPLNVWLIGIAIPLICLGTGLFIGLMRLEDTTAFAAAMLFFCLGRGGVESNLYMPSGFRELGFVTMAALFSLWSYFFLRFFLSFPSPSPLESRAPWLKWVSLATGSLFAVWNFFWDYVPGLSFAAGDAYQARWLWLDITQDVIFVLWFALGFAALAANLATLRSQVERRKLRILLVGALGLMPAVVLYVLRVVFQVNVPKDWAWLWILSALFVALFPLAFAYAVVKHRVFGIRLILRRGLQYALFSKGFLFLEGVALFLVLFFAVGPLLENLMIHLRPSVLAISLAGVTMLGLYGMRKLNARVMHSLDRAFFRETYDGRRILSELGRGLDRYATRPAWLAQTVTEKISDSLHPDQVAVFLKLAELARLPAGGDLQKRILKRHGHEAPGDFICFWRHVRQGSGPDAGEKTGPCASDALPADSLTVQELERMAGREPYTLDIDLDDPRSWAYDLVVAGPDCGARRTERSLLDRYHTHLVVPMVAHSRVIGFLSLGEKRSEEPYSKEDKDLLLSVARQLAVAMVYAGFIQEEAEQLKLKHDIAIAREVQEKLFPQRKPAVGSLSYLGACRPAHAVGGDCYDFLDLGGGRVGLALGDVSGKGVSAALLMASLQAMLRIHADVHGAEVHRIAWDINRLLCEITDANRFITFFYGVFDAAASSMAYVNAGHNPPLLLRPLGGMSVGAQAVRAAGSAPEYQVFKLGPTGMVLGVFKDAEFSKVHVRLRRGDLLVVYTDGITEAMNAEGEEYGERRLESLLHSVAHLTVAEVRDAVFHDVETFIGEAPQTDDITLVVAKVM